MCEISQTGGSEALSDSDLSSSNADIVHTGPSVNVLAAARSFSTLPVAIHDDGACTAVWTSSCVSCHNPLSRQGPGSEHPSVNAGALKRHSKRAGSSLSWADIQSALRTATPSPLDEVASHPSMGVPDTALQLAAVLPSAAVSLSTGDSLSLPKPLAAPVPRRPVQPAPTSTPASLLVSKFRALRIRHIPDLRS